MAADEGRMPVHHPLSNEGLTVHDAASPLFMATVERLLDPDERAKTAHLLPFALVAVNETGRYIWGFTVVFNFPDRIAPSGSTMKHLCSPSAGGPAHRPSMLGPGGRILVAPFLDHTPSCDAAGRRPGQCVRFIGSDLDRTIARFLSRSGSRMEASIDSIVYEDGSLVGPDTRGWMARVNTRIRAQKDLTAAVEGLHGEELRRKLKAISELEPDGEYSWDQTIWAKHFSSALEVEDESEVLPWLERMRTVCWFAGSPEVWRRL